MKFKLLLALFVLLLIGAGVISVLYYPYVFAKHVSGTVLRVERVNNPEMIIGGGTPQSIPANQLYSFAISIRDRQGEIHVSSSEDRKWAVAQPEQCAEATFFRYPPWQLEKGGTFYGARLDRLFDCPKEGEPSK